ncbi:uncharacterized protein [Nicotiana tomentosiformis]|uniref:uncharacterized protein n=1 Tax=Nicotiana tomentosiformis TaxID=4098 RepID=UPI00051BA5D2|nr:lipid transfer protein EARLI 1-like [Nicotiana tomentosiformis]
MTTMKTMLMLMVAVILFCSHQLAVAREMAVANDKTELQLWPWDIPCYLPWPFPWPRPYPCPPPRPRPCPPPPPPPCSPPPPPPSPPPPTPTPSSSCSASDKAKIDTCMVNTTKIAPCCPTFKSILGTSCPCYEYAEDVYELELMALQYTTCPINSPCKGVQVIKLSKEEE